MKFITEAVAQLSKKNLAECVQMCHMHSRLVYTLNKRGAEALGGFTLLASGELLQQVMSKEKIAAKALTPQLREMFKDLEQALTEIAVLYLAQGYEFNEEF